MMEGSYLELFIKLRTILTAKVKTEYEMAASPIYLVRPCRYLDSFLAYSFFNSAIILSPSLLGSTSISALIIWLLSELSARNRVEATRTISEMIEIARSLESRNEAMETIADAIRKNKPSLKQRPTGLNLFLLKRLKAVHLLESLCMFEEFLLFNLTRPAIG